MKIWIIVAVIGLLAIAGFVVANVSSDDKPVEEPVLSCGGGCSAGNSCGNPSCNAEKTGSCGCQG